MKLSRLQEHLNKILANKNDKDIPIFKDFKTANYIKLFASCSKHDNGLRASYNISLLIAKAGKPHTIGEELVMLAVIKVIETVLHYKTPSDIIKKNLLSNNTVQRRINEMAKDVELLLYDYLKTSTFSIQLNESTLPNNEALLLTYVPYIKEEKNCQELLFAKKKLETDTKGESIFNSMHDFFMKNKKFLFEIFYQLLRIVFQQ